MTVTWVLESNVFSEDNFDTMVAHLKAKGLPYHIVRIIPFLHEIDGKVPVISGPVVVYGSIGIQKLADRHGWRPGVFTDADTFNGEAYSFALKDLFLNASAKKMRLSEVQSFLLSPDGPEHDEFFIKPNGDNKEFAGTIMTKEAFGKWYQQMLDIGYLTDSDFDVIVSETQKLGCEWRVIVADGKIVDSSIYRQYGIVKPERNIIPEVEAIVNEAHRLYQPAPVYVIDIAQVGDTYKVIEYNTFNSAGFYACDPVRVIDEVTDLVERTYVD